MSRLILVKICVLVVPSTLFAQIGWIEHTIAPNFIGAQSVYAIDVDDARDVDVLGAAYWASDITWWESDLAPTVAEGDLDKPEAFKFRTPTININRGKAEIELTLPEATKVDLLIYDAVGRLCIRLVSNDFLLGPIVQILILAFLPVSISIV